MNRVNGVYEREVAVRMILVANNDLIVYTTPSTDPYTNNNGGTMLGQNQTNLDTVIGNANYDIGHVLQHRRRRRRRPAASSAARQQGPGRDRASRPRSATPSTSTTWPTRWATSSAATTPSTAPPAAAAAATATAATAYEPGSGSTIMAYAGICGAEDLQPHSDDYFHVAELRRDRSLHRRPAAARLRRPTATGNTRAHGRRRRRPSRSRSSTPFTLTGTATDAERRHPDLHLGGVRPRAPRAPPNTDNGSRPIFRSFTPTDVAVAHLPASSPTSSNNAATFGESLPTTTRTMNFRVTARDNRAGGGGVELRPTTRRRARRRPGRSSSPRPTRR